MAIRTKCDQILLDIAPQVASPFYVMDLQIL